MPAKDTNTWLVTHTTENTKCPFRRFIPGGYGCNLLPDIECTGRNCPAITPGGDTIDLGIPCAECGATDGWVCECRLKESQAWADGMEAGMKLGPWFRAAIDELQTALSEAGKILEDGYEGKDPTHPDYRPAWDAYEVIRKVMEGDDE